ncbi:MAG: GNAT family N-acetyltransferase [Erysipelotrichaceae bacterium]|jgi:RimJ/RimL family protein N-acetyltransferase|nr:GNAT family N-acetyltransferase [Erysipelotrichaceae bacterium]
MSSIEVFQKPIGTKRLVLRRFLESDGEALYAYLSNPKTIALEPYEPLSKEQAIEIAAKWALDPCYVAVCLLEGGLIGHLVLKPKKFDTYEVGYIFNCDYWKKGYAFESMLALLQHAFFTLSAHRVVARTNLLNSPSWKLLERLGFRLEGLGREDELIKKDEDGEPIWKTTCYYGLLESEYTKAEA